MAIARLELQIPELEGILERMKDVRRGHDLWRSKCELKRALDTARDLDREDRERIARQRRNREARMPKDGTPMTPQSMTRRGWRQG